MPVMSGIIDRRILVNYKVAPEIVKSLLPPHLEPWVINGYASAGICLLRLKGIGIRHTPSLLKITSENAAHRFLVTYKREGKEEHGVYIPRRDTDSRLNVLLAGKLLHWPHYPASFQSNESNGRYSVKMESADGYAGLSIAAGVVEKFPEHSMFDSVEHASECFRDCALGISPSTSPAKFKSIELKTKSWLVKPLQVHHLQSSYFENQNLFPEGCIAFDNALLMENIEHEWHEVTE